MYSLVRHLHLNTLLKRCLDKEPRQRIQAAGDVRLAMEGAFETTLGTIAEPTAPPPLQVWQRPIPLIVVGVALLAFGGLAVWGLMRPEAVPAADLVRFTIVPPESAPLDFVPLAHDLAISPDGTFVVYNGSAAANSSINDSDAKVTCGPPGSRRLPVRSGVSQTAGRRTTCAVLRRFGIA